jgi:hypothetical protein
VLATSLNYWRYAALGTPGSPIRVLSYGWTLRRIVEGRPFVVSGWWGRLGPQRAAVFVREGELRVAVDRLEWPVDEATSCRLGRDADRTKLELLRNGRVVASARYPTPRQPRQHWTDWPLDEEDYDFGRFIAAMIDRRDDVPDGWPFARALRGSKPTPPF